MTDTSRRDRVVPSLWAPLRGRAFRALWLAQLGSMLGTWMQTVGAQWVLVALPDSAALVALVQVAAMLPMLLFALPAGALADIMDRRRLLIGVQLFQLVVGSSLSVLTALQLMPPALLLTFTFLLGACLAATLPAYQVMVQEFVPREQVRMVAALGGVAVNGARAVGPALAGVLLAQVGAPVVFAVTAVSALAFVVVLLRTRTPRPLPGLPPERFTSAMRAGGRYVRNSPAVRRMLLRVFLFVLPGAVVWALLPVVANDLLAAGSAGFGVLLGSLGAGAVLGAAVLPRLTVHLSPNRMLVLSAVLFAVSLVACVTVPSLGVLAVLLVPAGMAWLFVLMSVTGALQVFLPQWVRARGLSTFNVVFAGSQAVGSLLWGLVAQVFGLVPTFSAAAVVMVAGAATVVIWPFPDVAHTWIGTRPSTGRIPTWLTSRILTRARCCSSCAMSSRLRQRSSSSRRWSRYGAPGYKPGRRLPAVPRRSRSLLVPAGPHLRTWEEHLRQAHRQAHGRRSRARGAGAFVRDAGGERAPLPGGAKDRVSCSREVFPDVLA